MLQVTDFSAGFRVEEKVLWAATAITLHLAEGEAMALVGESGSGKTVLARSVMGLLPATAVSRGRIEFDGRDVNAMPAHERRNVWGAEMAMIFQNPMTSLNPVVRIGRQITESLRHHLRLSSDDARARAIELLRAVRIPEASSRVNDYPHQLSGGMRQRVAIAMALACDPRLLIADEPTTALDVTVQAQILGLLQEQRRQRQMAMILVTHDLGLAAEHTETVAVMYAGEIVEQGPTSIVLEHMRMPYTEALLMSMPRIDDERHARMHTIGGRPPDLVNRPVGCRFAPRCPYVRDRCWCEHPPLRSDGRDDHLYRCWYPVGAPTRHDTASTAVNGTWSGG